MTTYTRDGIVLLTSRGGGHCMHVAEQIAVGRIAHLQLRSIITDNPSAEVIAKCKARGINIEIVCPSSYPTPKAFQLALSHAINSFSPSLVGLLGYLRLVEEPILTEYRHKVFNLHPSLLPRYRGLNAIDRAFRNGDTLLGATIHNVDETFDTGEVISQVEVEVTPAGTLGQAQELVHLAEADLLSRTLSTYSPKAGFSSIQPYRFEPPTK